MKEDFKEEGLLLTRQSPMGPAEGLGAGGSGQWVVVESL